MMKALLIFTLMLLAGTCVGAQKLMIVEQDYEEAKSIAASEDKLIFIDFYTTWCRPCKQLDKLVFQNDSIQGQLGEHFVLLRYDAENDTVHHLSKKHYIMSYPTGLIVNADGYRVAKKAGFAGEDFNTLSQSVLTFANEGIAMNKEGEISKVFSNKIDPSVYPVFYTDFINRTNTKIDSAEVNNYFITAEDIFSEHYFSTLFYLASYAGDEVAGVILENKGGYIDLYGESEVETLIYFLTSGKFERAIKQQSQAKYDEAAAFAKAGLNEEAARDILTSYEKENLMAQNRWAEVYEMYRELKDEGKFSNGYINHVSWRVYKDCDDQKVISKFLDWMKEVTDEEPVYDYLDTYAFLMHKSGNASETKRIARRAIEVARKEDRNTKNMEELINAL